MAKGNKNQKQKKESIQSSQTQFKIGNKQLDILFPILLTILLVILFKPLVIDGLSPHGVDVVGSIGHSHQFKEYENETNERALWNPYIFSGMPMYPRIRAVSFSVDSILNLLGIIFGNIFMYFLFAALGIYFLLRYMKFTPLVSLFGALAFILIPHYKSLFLVGHNGKIRAIMFIPWIILAFQYFKENKNILGAALFALAFGLQIRTQHYQIVFYTGLFIFAIGVYPFLKLLIDKDYKLFGKSTALLFASLLLAILMAAQPLFLANEYLPYSKRGKTTINLKQPKLETTAQKDGVNLYYATQWSTHPSELLTWFLPRFYGGMSNEKYSGNNVPQLKNREIPGYWGHMPFTQSYDYVGAITLMLAFIGIWFYRKDKLIISMIVFSGFLIVLSFGRHFEGFYSLFFNYFPYFNKFRAPSMSVTVNYFIFAVFATYGLRYLYELSTKELDWKKQKDLLIIIFSFFILGIILWISGYSMSFTKSGETYNPQVMSLITDVRKEFYFDDLTKYFIIIFIAAGSIFAYLNKRINFTLLSIIIITVTLFDLISVQNREKGKFIDLQKLENKYFAETATDKFLKTDKDIFRILPPAQSMNDNRWSYFHQSIAGYSPIKMYTIEELLENNVFGGWDKQLPINWNVLQMLNVKYAIFQSKLINDNLTLVHSNEKDKLYTYSFNKHLSRGFFVGKALIIKDDYERLNFINTPNFKPDSIALLEEELEKSIEIPDSSFCVVKEFTPNTVILDVFNDKQSLFVISELFYPPGWKIFIANNRVEKIYKTDHALMSVIMPAGNHKVELRFEPESFYTNLNLSYASLGIIYLTLLYSLIDFYRKRKKQSAETK